MTSHVRRFLKNRNAATAIEYALIAGGVALMIVAAVNLLGESLRGAYEDFAAMFSALDTAAALTIS